MVKEYKDAKLIAAEELYYLPVDILIPGARPNVITSANVNKIQAKLVVEAANIPVTDDAEEALFKRGIYSVPDFIANSGGILQGLIQMVGGDTAQVIFDGVKRSIQKGTREVLEASKANNVNPSKWAKQRAKEKVLQARAQRKVLSSLELRKVIKTQLGL
jgi:glutamate dehydrogenase/leucine dehydrogenase